MSNNMSSLQAIQAIANQRNKAAADEREQRRALSAEQQVQRETAFRVQCRRLGEALLLSLVSAVADFRKQPAKPTPVSFLRVGRVSPPSNQIKELLQAGRLAEWYPTSDEVYLNFDEDGNHISGGTDGFPLISAILGNRQRRSTAEEPAEDEDEEPASKEDFVEEFGLRALRQRLGANPTTTLNDAGMPVAPLDVLAQFAVHMIGLSDDADFEFSALNPANISHETPLIYGQTRDFNLDAELRAAATAGVKSCFIVRPAGRRTVPEINNGEPFFIGYDILFVLDLEGYISWTDAKRERASRTRAPRQSYSGLNVAGARDFPSTSDVKGPARGGAAGGGGRAGGGGAAGGGGGRGRGGGGRGRG
jgi:uncharacterized membrane protein YgcG